MVAERVDTDPSFLDEDLIVTTCVVALFQLQAFALLLIETFLSVCSIQQ